jgi:hypothetical protein
MNFNQQEIFQNELFIVHHKIVEVIIHSPSLGNFNLNSTLTHILKNTILRITVELH